MIDPNGRLVSVPAGMAGKFAGLSPVPAPPPVDLPPQAPAPPPLAPAFGPADAAALAAATPPAPPPPLPTDAPVTSPAQVSADSGGPRAPVGPVVGPGEVAAAPGPPNVPAPVTQKQLATMGEAGVLKAQDAAVDQQAEAARKIGDAQVSQANQIAAVQHAANVHADQQLADQQARAEANAKAMQDATNAYLQNAKKIADTKIDRTVDHPVVLALSVALNILGTAMAKGDMSKVMDPVYKAIDAKAQAQLEDLKVKQMGLTTQRDSLGLQKQAGDDYVSMLNTYRMAGLEQAQRKLEEIKTTSTSDITKANVDKSIAELQVKKSDLLADQQGKYQQRQEAAAARASAEKMHSQTIGATIRGQDLVAHENDLNRAERHEEALNTIAEKLLTAKGSAASEKAKQIKDLGLIDPSTGNVMLDPMGQKKYADADRMEAQARKDPTPVALAYVADLRKQGGVDPKQIDALEERIKTDPAMARKAADEYAGAVRQSAQLENVATVRTPKQQESVQKELHQAQQITNSADRAQRMLEQGPAAYDRDTWAALVVDLANVKKDYAATIGERVSVRALDAVDGVLSIDAENVFDRVANQGKAIAALKALKGAVAQDADLELKNAGIKSGWTPGAGKVEPVSFGGKTADEVGADAEPGVLGKAWEHIKQPVGGGDNIQALQDDARAGALGRRAEPSPEEVRQAKIDKREPLGATSDYGLDPKVDTDVRALVKRAGQVGHDGYAQIVNTLTAPLTSERDSLTSGVGRLIRDQDPKLFDDVMNNVAATSGVVNAKRIAELAAQTPDLAPAPRGGLTDRARGNLDRQKGRLREGLNPDVAPVVPLTPFRSGK